MIPYEGRLTCGACIEKLGGKPTKHGGLAIIDGARLVVCAGFGFLAMWTAFYALGRLLLKTPTIFYSNWLGS